MNRIWIQAFHFPPTGVFQFFHFERQTRKGHQSQGLQIVQESVFPLPNHHCNYKLSRKGSPRKVFLFLHKSTRVNFTQTRNSLPQKCSDFNIFPNMKKFDLTPAQLLFSSAPKSLIINTWKSLKVSTDRMISQKAFTNTKETATKNACTEL
jgi:hypothetical protein